MADSSNASVSLAKLSDLDFNLSFRISSLSGQVNGPNSVQSQNIVLSDLYIVCQLWSCNKPMTVPFQTAHKNFKSSYTWNESLTLPVKYKDLPLDVQLTFTVYDSQAPPNGPQAIPVGATTFKLFGKKCTLKRAKQRLFLHKGVEADAAANSSTPSKVPLCHGETDELGRLEKLVKKHESGDIPRLDWLDKLAFRQIEKIHNIETKKSTNLYLYIDLPRFDFPVVFSEYEYPPPTLPPIIASTSTANTVQPSPFPTSSVLLQNDSVLFSIIDPDVVRENPVEAKHRRLVRGHRSGPLDRELKPNAKIRDELNEILRYPPTQSLTTQQRDKVWRFRFYLSRDKRALNKFLKSVVWSDPGEVKQATEVLLPSWTDIEMEDALELLGPGEAFKDRRVRAYAVRQIARADDEELVMYLLQLVQALKFDTPAASATRQRSRHSTILPSKTTDALTLEEFLIQRSVANPILGNNLYWYLMCEMEDEVAGKMFKKVAFNYMTRIAEQPNGKQRRDEIRRQAEFTALLSKLAKDLRTSKDGRPKKIEKLKAALTDNKHGLHSFQAIPLPLDARLSIIGVDAEKSTIFKSNLFPLRLQLKTADGGEYPLIFKNGDDLRQDQLVLQLFTLMDRLLRKENLDLKILPYKVLATTAIDGMVQFVPSATIGAICSLSSEHGGSILAYLRMHHPDAKSTSTFGISPEVFDTYIRSCAGYCVVTYLLGVGDRHLDNLLLSPDGNFFHVDFGYILGRDPKLYPPAVKLSKEMVDAMGGMQSPHFQRFKKLCFTAFSNLRKSASLIINLISLMVDASIPDIKLEPDKAVMKVQEKFRLDLTEEEAIKHLEGILNETSAWASVLDKLHTAAQAFRS